MKRLVGRSLIWFVAKTTTRWACLLGFRLRAFGAHRVPARGGALIAANHQSYLDPVIVGVPLTRTCHFMARHTLFQNRAFGALLRRLNTFPVRRGEMDLAAMREAVQRLKSGECLVVFPEGTRSRDGRIGPMQAGALTLADRAEAPIVPAVVDGAFEAWPREGGIRLHPIQVWYGRPISAAERRTMDRAAVARLLRERMLEGQAFLKRRRARTGDGPSDA